MESSQIDLQNVEMITKKATSKCAGNKKNHNLPLSFFHLKFSNHGYYIPRLKENQRQPSCWKHETHCCHIRYIHSESFCWYLLHCMAIHSTTAHFCPWSVLEHCITHIWAKPSDRTDCLSCTHKSHITKITNMGTLYRQLQRMVK